MFRSFNHIARVACALALAGIAGTAMADASKWPPVVPSAAANVIRPAAAAAATAPRATIVQSIDDDAHAPYREGLTMYCSLTTLCAEAFTPVPVGRRRIIEHVSCIMSVPAPGYITNIALLATSYAPPRVFMNSVRSDIDPTQFTVDSQTLMSFEAGETPWVYATAPNLSNTLSSTMFCSLFGRDVAA